MQLQYFPGLTVPEVDHVLVLAEAGFSMLDAHARQLIGIEGVSQFAREVNLRGEVGTLYPQLALSAIPADAVRESVDAQVVERFVLQFLEALIANGLPHGRIGIELATPGLAPHVKEGIQRAVAASQTRPSLSALADSILVVATG